MSETPAIGASGLPGKRVEAQRAGITITLRMNGADSINSKDLRLVRRLALAAGVIFLLTAAVAKLERTYSQKFYDVTGRAQWIWAPHRMSDDFPLAFFATRDFDLPERRVYTHLKILGEQEYTIWMNGRIICKRNVVEESSLGYLLH